jgi:hypothetical protein
MATHDAGAGCAKMESLGPADSGQAASAEQLAAPKAGLPLMGLDGNSNWVP